MTRRKTFLNKYDVHCMDCGRSYERTWEPKKCTFKGCGSRNIIVEENSKYILENIFPGPDGWRPDTESGYSEHTAHIEGIV